MNAIPPPIAPLPLNQRNIDVDHLNLLSIFYFIAGGLSFLGIPFLMAHYAVMHAVFSNPSFWQNQKGPPPPPELFQIFHYLIWAYVAIGLLLVAFGLMNILSGIFLRTRKYRTFSFVVAAINCFQIPFGTILGVFTIVVLIRDSVRELYETAR
jgi:hypothetical protein